MQKRDAIARHWSAPIGPDGVRTTSRWLVVLLASFLLLTFLQPCCESLAELLPHSHGPAQTSEPGGHPPAGHDHQTPAQHTHCATSDGIDTVLPDFLTSGFPDPEPLFLLVALLMAVSRVGIFSTRSRWLAEHERGPPYRLYLLTLRLRI